MVWLSILFSRVRVLSFFYSHPPCGILYYILSLRIVYASCRVETRGMSQYDANRGWEEYFSSLPSGTPGKIEAESHTKRLASEGKRIFLGQGEIEMWRRDAENVGI